MLRFDRIATIAAMLFLPLSAWAQENYQQPVSTESASDKVYTTLNPDLLQQSLDTLFANGGGSNSAYTDILQQLDSLSCTWAKHHGYVYQLILIGNQCWFAENLRSETYANGDSIPGNLSNSDWTAADSGAQAVIGNDVSYLGAFGRLYNWHAVDDSRELCPSGWHVPSDDEWTELREFLGGQLQAGVPMKSSEFDLPAWDGSNTSGFSAVPGGIRASYSGDYQGGGNAGVWWSSTANGSSFAWARSLESGYNTFERGYGSREDGYSVRCLRD